MINVICLKQINYIHIYKTTSNNKIKDNVIVLKKRKILIKILRSHEHLHVFNTIRLVLDFYNH